MEGPLGGDSPLTSPASVSSMDGHDISAETSYHPYPASRPFINTDYQRSPGRPVFSFPESNRDGVLSALRNLQQKMQRLEVERRDAETKQSVPTSPTDTWSSPLRHRLHDPHHTYPHTQHTDTFRPARHSQEAGDNGFAPHATATGSAHPRSRVLESQLSSAETRCQLLEKQLDYMRNMVQTSERDRQHAEQKAETLQQQRDEQDSSSTFTPDYCGQLKRIGELERDHLRLTATQTLAESKIHELENKLKGERDHRKKLQDRALDLESAALSNQILLNTASVPDTNHETIHSKSKKPPSSKKKKKTLVNRKQIPVKSEPTKHFRLNLADIPFVAGQSTTPSHAVGANVQKVLALMKSHNLALCSPLYHGHGGGHGQGGLGGRCSSPSPSLSSSSSGDQDLADLLAQLQDEFGQLTFEHQEYMHHINEATDLRLREDLERELDALVVKMEAKGQQISKVRQHQQKLDDAKRRAKHVSKTTEHVPRPSSAMGRLQSRSADHHTHRHPSVRPRSTTRNDRDHRYGDYAHPSLNVLKDMRKLQSTLQRDDLFWE